MRTKKTKKKSRAPEVPAAEPRRASRFYSSSPGIMVGITRDFVAGVLAKGGVEIEYVTAFHNEGIPMGQIVFSRLGQSFILQLGLAPTDKKQPKRGK